MSKGNEHKKDYEIDEFARQYYCEGARLRQLREDKFRAKKKTRRKNKRRENEEGDERYPLEVEADTSTFVENDE